MTSRGVVRVEHFLYFALPAAPGKRAAAREVRLGSWPAARRHEFATAQYAYYEDLRARNAPPEEWPEGHATVETFASGRKQRTGVTFYFHGPLGWMDEGYVRGVRSHGASCEKCKHLFSHLEMLYPGVPTRDSIKCVTPTRGRWEAMEALVADKEGWRYRYGV